jgi:hypothetical protein
MEGNQPTGQQSDHQGTTQGEARNSAEGNPETPAKPSTGDPFGTFERRNEEIDSRSERYRWDHGADAEGGASHPRRGT